VIKDGALLAGYAVVFFLAARAATKKRIA